MRRLSNSGWVRRLTVVTVVVGAAMLGGCTGEDDPSIPTAGGSPTGPAGAPDLYAQEFEFVACMRDQGIADMPDPVPGDTSGRSAVRYAMDVMGKGSDPLFQAALEECMALLPELPDPGPPPPANLEALREFSQCMRDNGLADFPDPPGDNPLYEFSVGGGSDPMPAVTMIAGGHGEVVAVNLGDPVVAAAWEACQEIFPVSGGV